MVKSDFKPSFLHLGPYFTLAWIPENRNACCIYITRTVVYRHFLGVISGGHAVKVLKVPKLSQTKVFDKKKWKFLTSWGGPGRKTAIFSVFAGKLTFWLPAPKLSNLAPWTQWPVFTSTLRATIWYKFEVCSSTGLGDMGQNVCFGVARTTFPDPKKGRSAKTGQKIKKKLTVTPLKIKFWF